MQLVLRYVRPLTFVAFAALLVSAAILAFYLSGSFSFTGLVIEIQIVQRNLHDQLVTAVRSIQNDGNTAAWALVSLSFLYGVFHAAGPGHGKVIISTYLLTQESALRRGLLLAVFSSLVQGGTAIVAVAATVAILDMSLRQARGAADNLELVSYGLVALVGLILLAGRIRKMAGRATTKHKHDHTHADDHDHHHDHSHCGHSHGPSRQELEAPLSLTSMVTMVLSIGLRPCSGGVLLLLVAYSLDLRWTGILSVMVMSLGTAITVSAIATLSVYSRSGALWLASKLPDHQSRLSTVVDWVAIAGGLIILAAGVLMFYASWTMPVHPLQ